MPTYPDIVFTNVEIVRPDTVGTVLLGVSIAVQPATVPGGNAPWVGRPWSWTGITWTVLGRTGPGSQWQSVPSGSITVRPLPADTNEASWNKVIDALKSSMNAAATTLAAGPAGPNLPLSQNITVTNNSFQANQQEDIPVNQKWASLLLNLAAAPHPIPEKLQLTYFLELTGSTQYGQFLALPSFAVGKNYDPSTQLPPTTNPPDFWDIPSVNGLTMHSEFSSPNMGSRPLLPDDSLWLSSAHPAGSSPLVANWQAHLFELLGPYLDAAHLLTSPAFDPDFPTSLGATLGATPANWTLFRGCVLQGLYALVTAPGSAAPYNAATWKSTLSKTLTSLSPMPNALAANPVDSASFAQEMADLQRIVTAACTGNALGTLVAAENNTVPASYLSANRTPDLLALLQARLATAYAQDIAIAANSTVPAASPSLPDILDAVLQNLLQRVLRPNLLTLFNAVFTAASPLPTALGAVCYPAFNPTASPPAKASPTTAVRDNLFSLALGTTQPGAAPALTANAAPLVLPAVTARAADNTANAVDPLRGIRGVSVLLRRSVTKPTGWACPGIVSPVTQQKDQATQKLADSPQTDVPLLVATRLVYDRNLLTGSMLYNNGPLPCANLLHDYMDQSDRLRHLKSGDPNVPQGTPDPSAIPASVLQYVSYEGGGRLTPGTPALRAGALYEFVTFAISNSGALPVELRDNYPSRFKPLAGALPAGVQASSVRYFRTVPVAGLDTCDANGDRLQKQTSTLFPVIPANVWPRAADTVTKASGVGITGAAETPGPPPHLPLLLLTPPDPLHQRAARTTSNLTFSVRLPSVDPQTWLATVGYSNPQANVVLDGAYLLLQKQFHAPITDPLITSVDFTLYNWKSPKWSPASAPVTYSVDDLRNHDPAALPTVETLPIVISADTGTTNGVVFSVLTADKTTILRKQAQTIAANGIPAVNFILQPGEVYLLEARLQLKLDGPEGVSMMPGYAPGKATKGSGSAPTIAGYQLLLEIGSTAMPTDLIAPLSLKLLPLGGLPDQQVKFSLAANGVGWQNVHRIDFLRQMWNWTGRTQPVVQSTVTPGDLLAPQFFPAALAGNLADSVAAAWELIEFAERPPADHIESLSTFRPATTTQTAAFEFTLDLSLDPRATYLRVAPRIFSRYQGLYADTSWSVVSTIDNPAKASWVRTFVRSRVRTLKMPRLKALLPLTESAFAIGGTPGILAVFDGPAYDQAGLAERLNVTFVTASDPDLSGKTWTQAGPDALAGPTPTLSTPDQQHIPNLLWIGPIGHTSDPLSGLDHKFLSHSYIIRPNSADPKAKQDFSWWFAALRFQLSTDVPSTVFAQSIVSETSFGSWIQFLPGFQMPDSHQADLFDGWSFSVDTSTTQADGGGQTFTLRDEGGIVRTPGMKTTHLTPFLMVNRVVLDIAGVEREDYFGIAVYSGQGYRLLAGSDWSSLTKAQVRVIQTRAGVATKFSNHADFWQSVVGKATEPFTSDQQRTVPVNLSSPIKATNK